MAKTTTQPRMTGRGVTVPPGPSPGLSAAEVERSRAEHGDNRLTERRQRGFFSRFAANLGAAADVMHVSGGWRELYSDKSGTGEVSVPPCGFVFICEDAEKGTKNDR